MGFFSDRRRREIVDRYPLAAFENKGREQRSGEEPDFVGVLEGLRRSHLDRVPTPACVERIPLPAPSWIRVLRMPRAAGGGAPHHDRKTQFLTALHQDSVLLAVRLEQRNAELRVLLGLNGCTEEGAPDLLSHALACHFPGSRTNNVCEEHVTCNSAAAALVLGVPQSQASGGSEGEPDLGSIVSALRGIDFGLTLMAEPVNSEATLNLCSRTTEAVREWSLFVRQGVDVSSQPAQTISRSIRREYLRRDAQQAVELAELMLGRYDLGLAEGLWEWWGILWTADPRKLGVVAALVRSLYSGADSLPEPLRVLPLGPLASDADAAALARFRLGDERLGTLVPSSLLARFLRFPTRSFSGLSTVPSVSFSTAGLPELPDRRIVFGAIQHHEEDTGELLSLALDSLTSHVLVSGMTGSGKTNSCMRILRELWKNGVPFLVIEPVKTEYRDLLRDAEIGAVLRVFTLGDETTAPFRINPFECPDGFRIATHLDLLKSVLVTSFSMYGPMPHILEEAVVRVYEGHGWDLASGRNRFASELPRHLLFPSLSDLLEAIDPVVDAIGYAEELSRDIRGALRARIRSLLTGPKGLMLNAVTSTSVDELLTGPAVLELNALGDDQERALLMGLLVLRVYELRQVAGDSAGRLRHVTLIEEAHRILRHAPAIHGNPEIANVVGKAVDTFNNVLSEIRAYGEGLVISEQIPAKLSPDAIKSSGVKITHRLHAPDDRAAVGGCMVLSETQGQQLARLGDLKAVVFGGGLTEAVQVDVEPSKPGFAAGFVAVADGEIRERFLAGHFGGAVLEKFASCSECVNKCHRTRDVVERSEEQVEKDERKVRYLALSWVNGPGPAVDPEAVFDGQIPSYCLAAHLAHAFVRERASFYRLTVPERVMLERSLQSALTSGDRQMDGRGVFANAWRGILERKLSEQTRTCVDCDRPICTGHEAKAVFSSAEACEQLDCARTPAECKRILHRLVSGVLDRMEGSVEDELSYCLFVYRQNVLGLIKADIRYKEMLMEVQ